MLIFKSIELSTGTRVTIFRLLPSFCPHRLGTKYLKYRPEAGHVVRHLIHHGEAEM